MTKLNGWNLVCALPVLYLLMIGVLQAQTFTTLVAFDGTNGVAPDGPLAQGPDGTFFGTTIYGGTGGGHGGCIGSCGTVFNVTTGGILTSIYSFCPTDSCPDGSLPEAGLVLGTDGSFYGTNTFGGDTECDPNDGCGTVFQITTEGMLTTLHVFSPNDSQKPYGVLVQAADGNFYGTANNGGVNARGTVFKMNAAGTVTTLYSFCSQSHCTDGAYPSAGLIQATDGALYGTTSEGGDNSHNCAVVNGCGTVFRITSGGKLTTVHSFNGLDGSAPGSALIQGTDGNLYGTTQTGGSSITKCSSYLSGCGTVFKISPVGKLTTIYSFCQQSNCPDGALPRGLVQATDGSLYGITYGGGNSAECRLTTGCGTVFKLSRGGTLTTFHAFGMSDGPYPSSLMQATNGTFYGTTYGYDCFGNRGCGTVFSLSTGLGPFVTFVRDAAKARQRFGILGQGFTGTTAVLLNGMPAPFTVKSDTFILATVPTGATTGYVTVTTPSGTLMSNKAFYVIP